MRGVKHCGESGDGGDDDEDSDGVDGDEVNDDDGEGFCGERVDSEDEDGRSRLSGFQSSLDIRKENDPEPVDEAVPGRRGFLETSSLFDPLFPPVDILELPVSRNDVYEDGVEGDVPGLRDFLCARTAQNRFLIM